MITQGDWSVRAALGKKRESVLLVKKPGEKNRWRLPGSRKKPSHKRWEDTASESTFAKAGVRCTEFRRIGNRHSRSKSRGSYELIYTEGLVCVEKMQSELKERDPSRKEGEIARVFSCAVVANMGSSVIDTETKRFLKKHDWLPPPAKERAPKKRRA